MASITGKSIFPLIASAYYQRNQLHSRKILLSRNDEYSQLVMSDRPRVSRFPKSTIAKPITRYGSPIHRRCP